MEEKSVSIDYNEYFKKIEQKRSYESLKCEQKRRFKQQQIWLAMDPGQESILDTKFLEENALNFRQKPLPHWDEIEINDSQILKQTDIKTLKIINGDSYPQPSGFYERLLIGLNQLFYERLDYYNITVGRTKDKSVIKVERFDNQNEIYITMNHGLLEDIQKILTQELFSFYPAVNLRIET